MVVEERKEGEKKKHLPYCGVGPFYNYGILIATIMAVIYRNASVVEGGKLDSCYIGIQAIFISKLFKNIEENKLVTTGIFSWVRNPVYSGTIILCVGILFITGNAYFFILPFIFWAALTILMINTEEKWLRELYGEEFDDYCKKVNRCIPIPPKLKNFKFKEE
ncbi:hypothetical protein PIROE2DRAFT_14586 [Piromyces sp. E2]|nr:hypothetical protein PIROE2DRAFT_14586 [Piromyces sp. E2]|eukprot:OUM59788.1 hypothetical protein PIROE2DRAFT_14586 [Piromyces sp. E2]